MNPQSRKAGDNDMAIDADLKNVKDSITKLSDKFDNYTDKYVDTVTKLTESTVRLENIENQISKQSVMSDHLLNALNDMIKKFAEVDKKQSIQAIDVANDITTLKVNAENLEKKVIELDRICGDLQSDKKSLINSIKTLKVAGSAIVTVFAVLGYIGFNVSSIKLTSDTVKIEQHNRAEK